MTTTALRTPRRGWVDALIAGVDRLPFPPWLLYLVATVAIVGANVISRLVDGAAISPVTTAFEVLTFVPFWSVHYLTRTARRSLADFRPALGRMEPEYPLLERELTTMPWGLALVAALAGVALQVLGLATSGGNWGVTGQTSVTTDVLTVLAQLILDVGLLVYVFRSVRQVIWIVRIHREATGIRLYDTVPQTAFSRLTFLIAISLSLPLAAAELLALVFSRATAVDVVGFFLVILIAVPIFVLPLSGMHRRLLREKTRQLAASDEAFEAAAVELHDDIAKRELARSTPLHEAMQALVLEHERLAKISTWPWSAATFRGFLTSIGLPILIWLATTLLGRFLP